MKFFKQLFCLHDWEKGFGLSVKEQVEIELKYLWSRPFGCNQLWECKKCEKRVILPLEEIPVSFVQKRC